MQNISEEVQGAEHWLSLENTPAGSGSQANTHWGFPKHFKWRCAWCIVFGRKVIDDGDDGKGGKDGEDDDGEDGEDGEDDADDDDDDGEDDGVLF